jgi:D-arabinose 1-dehydrogenase-like Zn-dependent alcohol dehydrogenase
MSSLQTSVSKDVTFLAGWKTYIVAVVTAALGVYNLTTKVHLDTTSIIAFLGAGGLGALRAAIAKVEVALKSAK